MEGTAPRFGGGGGKSERLVATTSVPPLLRSTSRQEWLQYVQEAEEVSPELVDISQTFFDEVERHSRAMAAIYNRPHSEMTSSSSVTDGDVSPDDMRGSLTLNALRGGGGGGGGNNTMEDYDLTGWGDGEDCKGILSRHTPCAEEMTSEDRVSSDRVSRRKRWL